MPVIPVRFSVEGSADVSRVMGGISAAYRRTLEVIDRATSTATLNMKEAHKRLASAVRNSQADQRRGLRTLYNEWNRTERALVDANRRGSADRVQLANRELDARKRLLNGLRAQGMTIEAELTRTLEQQAGRRLRILSNESSQRRRMLDAEARASNRAGGGGFAAGVGSAIRQGGAAAYGVATRLHSEVQDARRTRAETMQTAIDTFRQLRDLPNIRERLQQVTSFARASGMNAQELMAGLTSAQDTFAILGEADEWGRMDSRARSARVQSVLESARYGRNLGMTPQSALRLTGMLAQQGMRRELIPQALRDITAMSFLGAITPDQITAEALAPLAGRFQQAQVLLGPNATNEQRQGAMMGALRQTIAESHFFARLGRGARISSNTMEVMNRQLQSQDIGEKMANNVMTAFDGSADQAQRARLRGFFNDAFERDPTRQGDHFRLREQYRGNALALSESIIRNHLTSTESFNLFAGGGHGNPRALRQPMNILLSALASVDAQGITGAESVRQIMRASLTDTDVTQMRDAYENSPLAELTRNEEARLSALTDNSSKLVELSNKVADLTARMPVQAAALQGLAMPAAGLAAQLLSAVFVRQAAGAAVTAALGGGAATLAAGGGGGLLGAGAGFLGMGLGTMGAVGGFALAGGGYMALSTYAQRHGTTAGDLWSAATGDVDAQTRVMRAQGRRPIFRNGVIVGSEVDPVLQDRRARNEEAHWIQSRRNSAPLFFQPGRTEAVDPEAIPDMSDVWNTDFSRRAYAKQRTRDSVTATTPYNPHIIRDRSEKATALANQHIEEPPARAQGGGQTTAQSQMVGIAPDSAAALARVLAETLGLTTLTVRVDPAGGAPPALQPGGTGPSTGGGGSNPVPAWAAEFR